MAWQSTNKRLFFLPCNVDSDLGKCTCEYCFLEMVTLMYMYIHTHMCCNYSSPLASKKVIAYVVLRKNCSSNQMKKLTAEKVANKSDSSNEVQKVSGLLC